jgi:predicted ATPase
MKISIQNFKSIDSVNHFDLKPFTILSGTNSSGKSSFIQFLLILKQTLEIDSSKFPLLLDGYYFNANNVTDLVHRKDLANKIKFELVFNKKELIKYSSHKELNVYEAFDDYDLHIETQFHIDQDKNVYVELFQVVITSGIRENFIRFSNHLGEFKINTDVGVFNNEIYMNQDQYEVTNIEYSGFIPSTCTLLDSEFNVFKIVPELYGIKSILKDFFENLRYIGPLRVAPKESYHYRGLESSVGVDGSFVAEVLTEYADSRVNFSKVIQGDGFFEFRTISGSLIEGVKYWLCDVFNLCQDVISKKVGEDYFIYIKSFNEVQSTIRHVGFGISQVLPIIVEGLLMRENQVLLVEQPEVHLHPKVQSGMADFFISLVHCGKKIIVETHSDHLITRVRRRIAEENEQNVAAGISLTFIESINSKLIFRNINIDDLGNLDYFPDDFIENQDIELSSIIKAQMKKQLAKYE